MWTWLESSYLHCTDKTPKELNNIKRNKSYLSILNTHFKYSFPHSNGHPSCQLQRVFLESSEEYFWVYGTSLLYYLLLPSSALNEAVAIAHLPTGYFISTTRQGFLLVRQTELRKHTYRESFKIFLLPLNDSCALQWLVHPCFQRASWEEILKSPAAKNNKKLFYWEMVLKSDETDRGGERMHIHTLFLQY